MSKIKKLYPPGTIGIVGGGQLGRMFVYEAKTMGYKVIVLDPKEKSPAGQVADEQIVAAFDDKEAYLELARRSDIITYEFEHINAEILRYVEEKGFKVIPSSKTLEIIQNKYRQKTFLKEKGVKLAEFSLIENYEDLKSKFEKMGNKLIIKSCTDGYDGKGNYIVKNLEDLEKGFSIFKNQEIFIEELIDFTKEVSILMVKSNSGLSLYPVSENIHQDSILIKSLVPASIPEEVIKKIHNTCEKIAEAFDDFGVFCIELFVDKNQEVLVNEIAPRPHNSGHYTIEGCVTSQYEQLLRVVCGMPAGSTDIRMPSAMYNILGNDQVKGEYIIEGIDKILEIEDCHFHLYGKAETSNLRKIGHITALGETTEIANTRAKKALDSIKIIKKA